MGGRGASSATNPQSITSIDSAQNFEQVKSYAATKGITVDDSLSGFNLEGLKVAVSGIEAVIDEYPNVIPEGLLKLRAKNTRGMASASFNGYLNLPAKYWETQNGFNNCISVYDDDVRAKWHPDGTTVNDILSHETGHIIERVLIDRAIPDDSDFDKANQWIKSTQATKVIAEACRAVKKTPYGKGKRNDDLVLAVSEYAKEGGRSEALAECVADYARNGSEANPLSVAVHDILIKKLLS